MKGIDHADIAHFCLAGINYKKTDALLRGKFAIGADQYLQLLDLAPHFGLTEVFVVSTCNRTEIYGLTDSVHQLIDLLCTQTAGDATTFTEIAYTKTGIDAVSHLFEVAAGLDSQILGDYEIVGQIKQSVKVSREKGFIGATLDRLTNAVLQSSKAIKNRTELSGGTVSVSFAAVQYIKSLVGEITNQRILLVGTGKIGRITCKNMIDYLGTTNIILVNRTEQKAAILAEELHLSHAPVSELPAEIAKADIILVATNAATPTILTQHLRNTGKKIIIDVSIPYNVEASAQELDNVTLVNVDELSRLKDETLQKRVSEVPKAMSIIAEHMAAFSAWHDMRKHVPVLQAVRNKLEQIHSGRSTSASHASPSYVSFSGTEPEARIQKVITTMAVKMRQQNQRGCQYIEAINDFMATGTN